jgi:hypothetical protein
MGGINHNHEFIGRGRGIIRNGGKNDRETHSDKKVFKVRTHFYLSYGL